MKTNHATSVIVTDQGAMEMRKSRFTLGDVAAIGIGFVVIAVSLSVGATVVNNIRDTQTSGTFAFNASTDGLEAIQTLSSYAPLIATAAAGAVVIGLVVRYLGGRGGE